MDARHIFLAVGVALTCGALVWFWRSRRFARTAVRTLGEVLRLEERRRGKDARLVWAPVVEFSARERKIVFTDSIWGPRHRYVAGQQVPVFYDAANPEDARIAGAAGTYLGPVALLVIGIGFIGLSVGALHMRSRMNPPAPDWDAALERFAGKWTNTDPGTRGITRVEIAQAGRGADVRMWGACTPQECDWGRPHSMNTSNARKGTLVLEWRPGFAERLQRVSLLPDGRLQVVTATRFTDRSGRKDYESTEYFAK